FGEEVLIFCLRVRSLRCLFVKGAYGCILGTLFRSVQSVRIAFKVGLPLLKYCNDDLNFRVISDSLMEGVLMDTIKHVGLRDPTDDKIVFEYMETVFFVDVRILYQSNSLEDQATLANCNGLINSARE
ncbi:hypothetical protein Tco_1350894, partial [Tanacetum coccineum]